MDAIEWLIHVIPLLSFVFGSGALGWLLRSVREHRAKAAEDAKDLEDLKASVRDLAESVEKNGERLDAVAIGLLAAERKNLVDAYEDYVVNGDPLTVERRHEIDKQYEAYKALGGNGTIGRLYQEICHIPTHIVGEKGD